MTTRIDTSVTEGYGAWLRKEATLYSMLAEQQAFGHVIEKLIDEVIASRRPCEYEWRFRHTSWKIARSGRYFCIRCLYDKPASEKF